MHTKCHMLAGSVWAGAETVRGFVESPPNPRLLNYAGRELDRLAGRGVAVDIGCGAGRNTVPLARMGFSLIGVDMSWPMLEAAALAIRSARRRRAHLVFAAMDRLPLASASAQLVIAHGIWNLARSDTEFRAAIAEGVRVLAPGGALFVFTFSRNTLPETARPIPGNRFVFTQFSGQPQCFVTGRELRDELAAFDLLPDPALPLVEHNRPNHAQLRVRNGPVIYEGAFRKAGAPEGKP